MKSGSRASLAPVTNFPPFTSAWTGGGESWLAEPSGTSADLYDVKALSATQAWAVGGSGKLLRRQ
jgi:hypothetical protein